MSPVPRSRVTVPAYEVQAYPHDCLQSVLSRSFAGLELIVDDCSADACGAIAAAGTWRAAP
jgi:CRISPR system Cascade subunit CasB